MQLVFRPEAQQELLEAQAWYEARSPGLGFEFARAVDAAIARAFRMPLAFAHIEDEFRHVITRKFPYSVVYHSSESELVVVSCFHHRRKPGSWSPNIRGG
jgi:plasmid stabilization system protein ParE